METPEPRDKFNDRTGRTEVFKLRDTELKGLLNKQTGLVKHELVEERMCPACGGHPKNARQLWIKEGLFYNKCTCGMVYISPMIKEEEMDKYYGKAQSAKKWLEVLQAQEDLDEAKFGHLLDLAAREFRPNVLTAYLFELAGSFSVFYDNCPVLKAESHSLRQSRLILCDHTARVIKQGLELLGIETIESM